MQFDIFDKISLFSHLSIDVKYNCYWTNAKLNESCGLMPDSYVYSNMFDDFLESDVIPNIDEDDDLTQFFNKKFDLRKMINDETITTPFVEYIGVQVKVRNIGYDKTKSVRFVAKFDIDDSHFDCTELDNDSIDPYVFATYRLNQMESSRPCACIGIEILYKNVADIKYYASYNFMHELMHAYDAFCHYKNNAKSFQETNFYKYYSILPRKINPVPGKPITDEQILASFIYYTCQGEQNAMNGQFKKEIDAASEYFGTSDDVWNTITKTSV
jgi:hypothetical protein